MALAIAQLIVIVPPALTSYFTADDWLYLALAEPHPWSWGSWLSASYFQHFAPGHRALFSALAATEFRSWTAVVLVQGAVLATATFLLATGLRRLGVSAAIALTGTAAFALHPALARPMQWLSAGAQLAPTLLVVGIVVACFSAFRRDGRARWGVLSALAVTVGLLFYIRPLVALATLTLFALAAVHPWTPRRVLGAVGGSVRFWAPITVPCAIYTIVYLAGDYFKSDYGSVTLGQYVDLARVMWLRGYSPGLVGQLLPGASQLGSLDRVAQVAAQVLVLGVVTWSLVRGGWRAVRLWAAFALAFAVNVYLLGSQRVPSFGVQIGADPRYVVGVLWAFPVIAAVAASGPADSRWRWPAAALERMSTATRPSSMPRWATGAALAACVLALGGSAGTQWQDSSDWIGRDSRDWAETFDRTITRVPQNAAIVDGEVPFEVLAQTFTPYNRISVIGPQIDPDMPAVGATASGRLYGASSGGDVTPARFRPLFEKRLARRCVRGPGSFEAVAPHPLSATGSQGLYARLMGVRSRGAVSVTLVPATPEGEYSTTSFPLRLPSGNRRAAVGWLGPQSTTTKVRIDVPAMQRVCADSIAIGAMQPLPGG